MVMNNEDLGPSMSVYLKRKHIEWRCLRVYSCGKGSLSFVEKKQ